MVVQTINSPMEFSLPEILECAIPTEERGINRDEVRLLVSNKNTDQIHHTNFKNIVDHLQDGDVLIINTSGTLKAAIPVTLPNREAGRIHLSTRKKDGNWLAEIRQVIGNKTKRYNETKEGDCFELPDGGILKIEQPFYRNQLETKHLQLWNVRFTLNDSIELFLEKHGIPIRYSDVQQVYPSAYYQTVFANVPGSAEMPSAGRAFTHELVTQLMAKGIQFAPILLHTGVASLEVGEQPFPEYFKVTPTTADIVNRAKLEGRRIIAVGTTAIRAIESSTEESGLVVPQEGFTNLFITPTRGLNIVNGLLTGFHEPKASHLLMLEALADRSHLAISYQEAVQEGYQWHEFGDLHLLIS